MALQTFDGNTEYAIDTATRKLHLVTVAADGTVTDLGAIVQDVGNITLANTTIDLGTVGILNASNTQVTPALETGGNLASILTAIQATNGDGLTFTAIPIAQGSTAGTTHIKAGVASNYLRLHALIGTVAAAGSVTIQDTASSPVVLIGAMTLAQNGGVVIPFNADSRGCPITSAVNLGINLVTSGTGAGFNGYAIISQATS